MAESRLVLSLPQGMLTATSLSLDAYAWHRSPGSGKYFQGRTVLVELALDGGKPALTFLDEGGWRDAGADAAAALDATKNGKKTKTALSNNAFSCSPVGAYRDVYLVKTGGDVLALDKEVEKTTFAAATCHEGMSPAEVAKAIGTAEPKNREPRLYMTLAPVELLVLSTLTPVEYAWYATHRPGKVFRQTMFTEIRVDREPRHLVAESVYNAARQELVTTASKKTKTVLLGDCINRIPYQGWVGYDREAPGGLYVGDAKAVSLWQFPREIPRTWDRAY